MCWDSDLNCTRLKYFAEAVEDARATGGTESAGTALCQEEAWDGCVPGIQHPVAWTGLRISKHSLDPARSKIIAIESTTKESSN